MTPPISTAPAPHPTRELLSGRRSLAALSIAYGFLVCLHWFLIGPRSTPVLYHDGAGYLLVARYLAGIEPVHTLITPFTHFGYSITLVPAWLLGRNPEHLHWLVLHTNGLLASSSVFPLYLLARRMCALPRHQALVAATLTGLYPTTLIYSGLVWAENLLPAVWCWFLVQVGSVWRRATWLRVVGLVTLGTVLVAVHPRTLFALPFAVLIAILAPLVTEGTGARIVTLRNAIVALLFGLLAWWLLSRFNQRIEDVVWAGAPRGGGADMLGRASGLLRRIFELLDLWYPLLGQLWYLLTSTVGIVLVGVVFLAPKMRRRSMQSAASAAAVTSIAGSAAMLGISVLTMSSSAGRIDLAVYGRYNEGLLAPLLLAGLAAICTRKRQAARWLLRSAGVMSFLGVLMIWSYGSPAPKGLFSPHTVVGLLPYGYRYETLPIAKACLGSVCVAGVVALLLRWRVSLALGLVAVAALFGVLRVQAALYQPLDIENHRLFSLADTVVDSELPGPLSYDLSALDEAALNAYTLELLDKAVVRFADSVPPASDLVIAGQQPPAGGPWVELAREVSRQQSLWARGAALEQAKLEGVTTSFEAEKLYSELARPWRLTERHGLSGRWTRRASADDLPAPDSRAALVSGPRTLALPGTYELEVVGWVEGPQGDGWVAATVAGRATPFASGQLPGPDEPHLVLRFEVPEIVNGLEFRTSWKAGTVELDAFRLTRFLPGASAGERGAPAEVQ